VTRLQSWNMSSNVCDHLQRQNLDRFQVPILPFCGVSFYPTMLIEMAVYMGTRAVHYKKHFWMFPVTAIESMTTGNGLFWCDIFLSRNLPVCDDISLCVSSDWLWRLCHVISAGVLLVVIVRHNLSVSQGDNTKSLILVLTFSLLFGYYRLFPI